MMPGENGFDLAGAIRAGSAVPILMLTARTKKKAAFGASKSAPTTISPNRLSPANCRCG